MPRLAKRKRDEARFGKAERLADRIVTPTGVTLAGLDPIIEATNVFDYYLAMMEEKGDIDLAESLPGLIAPFPLFFIEMKQSTLGLRTGWLYRDLPADHAVRRDPEILACEPEFKDAPRAMYAVLFLAPDGQPVRGPCASAFVATDEHGTLIGNPAVAVATEHAYIAGADHEGGAEFLMATLVPSLLAITFLNCRRTRRVAVDPPAEFIRARKKAGCRPLLRYHVLDIGGTTDLIRVEGRAGEVGLKRALHIARGHFKRFAEERPMFGREGLHGLFWIPAHVRGHVDQGVVLKDYRVNPAKS